MLPGFGEFAGTSPVAIRALVGVRPVSTTLTNPSFKATLCELAALRLSSPAADVALKNRPLDGLTATELSILEQVQCTFVQQTNVSCGPSV